MSRRRAWARRHLRAGVLAIIAVLSVGLAACGDHVHEAVRVAAAASLSGVLEEVVGPDTELMYGGSATLARQILMGAPVDVFVSAHPEWVDELERDGRVRARRLLCGNRLVLVGAHAAPALTIEALAEVPGRIAIADPALAPAGRYARAVLEAAGVWEVVAPRLVPALDVRAALAYVERGACEFGLVYATDVAQAPRVSVLAAIPEALAPPIRYEAALLEGARPEAHAAYGRLFGEPARAILAARGFDLTGAP